MRLEDSQSAASNQEAAPRRFLSTRWLITAGVAGGLGVAVVVTAMHSGDLLLGTFTAKAMGSSGYLVGCAVVIALLAGGLALRSRKLSTAFGVVGFGVAIATLGPMIVDLIRLLLFALTVESE